MFTRLFRPAVALAAALAAGSMLVVPASTAQAGKHPEPSVYPLPTAWYLTFKHGAVKRIVVDVPGSNVPAAYWYLTYVVTNNTGKEVDFLPDFELVTQDGKIHRSDQAIPLPVFNAIKRAEGNDLLISPTQIAGPLHQGEDQAKDSVAIWREPPGRLGTFSIYVGGLNSEFVHAADNDGKPITDADGKPITLRKTLELDYTVWGDEVKPELDLVHPKPDEWIMR
ncbi:MAG TPA: hypothetical protein VG326_07655 [Tepidisphaeraceae bacterium]|jgi:hypothetical protein|nr:hypothetical protein [Tepidisphaeraceae bacterium]